MRFSTAQLIMVSQVMWNALMKAAIASACQASGSCAK